MASSDAGTSSGKAGGGQYQVFLNFHGQDTRVGFTSLLHRDLRNNGIHTFIDNEGLRVGEEIGGALLQAIDDSKIYIPIFSQNYASSKWCLRELARMVDNTTTKSEEKKIMPIFLDVEPDDVNLKTPLYITTIEKHKEEHKKFPDEVRSWEEALQKVDKIKGWVLSKCTDQAELLDLVVEKVLQELKIRYKSVTEDLVGLDHRVAEVLEKLDVNCNDGARLLKVHGMGGIGKTTLARVVYNELSSCFGKCYAFLKDVRETSRAEGLLGLQKKLLKAINNSTAAEIIDDVDNGRERIEATLGSNKVLIVLDDVDEEEQIKNLIGQDRLHPGTRIIITTRSASVLKIGQRMARNMKEVNSDYAIQILTYEMEGMGFYHSLQLFKRHAFPKGSLAKDFDNPSLVKDFDSLSISIVNTTGGLPLALTLIGSSLYGKEKKKWMATLNKLQEIPNEEVHKKLMISYDALSEPQRKIFLDIACFFINEDVTNTIYMWTDCELFPDLEIDVLVSMSLIKIQDNKFWMHDQLRDMGWKIACQESRTSLGKYITLATSEKILDLIRTEEGNKDVEALELWTYVSNISISHEEIGRFKSLRFLRLSHGTLHGDSIISLPKLRWISWESPSSNFSVPSMHPNNLVVIELFDNKFTDDSKVWDLIKKATKLKSLTLVKCHCLTRTPDLFGCPTLERLTFDHCGSLKKIDNSIGKLKCLLHLNIICCGLIEQVPDEIGGLVKLGHFSLNGSYKVSRLPTSIGDLASLTKLDLSETRLTSLPESIRKLRCLLDLNLGCLRFTEIPSEIEGLVELRHLNLEYIEIKQFPNFIGKLKSLCTLNLSNRNRHDPNRWELPKAIEKLEKLEELYLDGRYGLVGEIPDEIGHLTSLKVLNLSDTKIDRISGTIDRLSRLTTLNLIECNGITELPELPTSLVQLHFKSSSLQRVPNLSKLTNLVDLLLSDNSDYQNWSNLEHIQDLRWIGRLSKLNMLNLCLLDFAAPPTELGFLSLLDNLTLHGLDLQPLEQLPPSLVFLELENFDWTGLPLSNLRVLSELTLCQSQLQEIQLDELSQLRRLTLDECDLRTLSIPSSLRTLVAKGCDDMIDIQFLGTSASLKKLAIRGNQSIARIVLCGVRGSLKVLDQPESSLIESTDCSPGVLLLTNAFGKLKELELVHCKNLLEIQVIGTLLSLQGISITWCDAMEKLIGISNLKNLHKLAIKQSSKLPIVEGLDEQEFTISHFHGYLSPKTKHSLAIFNPPRGYIMSCIRMMARQGAPQSETNKEKAKMEGDAVETDTELQPQVHPSASSRDHEISEGPPIDNVREGTPPEKQNQTMEKDSKPLSLDKLASLRTFCDRFKTCLASILECICNHDFLALKLKFFEVRNRGSI